MLTTTSEISKSVNRIEKSHQDTTAIAVATSDSINHLKESSSLTLGAIEDFNQTITGIERVPEQISRVVENTIHRLLEQHLARISEETRREILDTGRKAESEEALATQDLAYPNGSGRLRPSS
jgi:hypothetical protein